MNVISLCERQERKDHEGLRKRTQAIGNALETGRLVVRKEGRKKHAPREPSFAENCILTVTFWDGLIAGLAFGIAGTLALINPGL